MGYLSWTNKEFVCIWIANVSQVDNSIIGNSRFLFTNIQFQRFYFRLSVPKENKRNSRLVYKYIRDYPFFTRKFFDQ